MSNVVRMHLMLTHHVDKDKMSDRLALAELHNVHYYQCMKTITINVSEPVYDDFRRAAQTLARPTSELIREAMAGYRRARLRTPRDLLGFRPQSLARLLQPLSDGSDERTMVVRGKRVAESIGHGC